MERKLKIENEKCRNGCGATAGPAKMGTEVSAIGDRLWVIGGMAKKS